MIIHQREIGYTRNYQEFFEALTNAKIRYASSATYGGFSVYDEKAMIEATLYGLPMSAVSVPDNQPIGGSNVQVAQVPKVLENPIAGLDVIESTVEVSTTHISFSVS